jgi:hypothetical protein
MTCPLSAGPTLRQVRHWTNILHPSKVARPAFPPSLLCVVTNPSNGHKPGTDDFKLINLLTQKFENQLATSKMRNSGSRLIFLIIALFAVIWTDVADAAKKKKKVRIGIVGFHSVDASHNFYSITSSVLIAALDGAGQE